MKLHPPPVVNQRVTADMLHWVMRQSNTVTMNTATNEFTITPGKGAQDYPINLSVRITMLRELIAILAYNGFNAYEQTTGTLMVKKRGWSFEVPGILDQMPFPDYLPHQINKAYECWKYERDNLDRAMSYELSTVPYNLYTSPYPSREQLEEVRRIVEDSIDDTNKD